MWISQDRAIPRLKILNRVLFHLYSMLSSSLSPLLGQSFSTKLNWVRFPKPDTLQMHGHIPFLEGFKENSIFKAVTSLEGGILLHRTHPGQVPPGAGGNTPRWAPGVPSSTGPLWGTASTLQSTWGCRHKMFSGHPESAMPSLCRTLQPFLVTQHSTPKHSHYRWAHTCMPGFPCRACQASPPKDPQKYGL
jgi:hypothetical protein